MEKILNELASLADTQSDSKIGDSGIKPIPREEFEKRMKILLNNPKLKENFDDSFCPIIFSEVFEKPCPPMGLNGIEIAKFFMDRTPALEFILKSSYKEKGNYKWFLGEI